MNKITVSIVACATIACATPPKLDTLIADDGSKAGLWVPKAKTKLPLVVWLHGGIGANNHAKGVAAAFNMAATWADSGAFALLAPSAWPASPWWSLDAAVRVAGFIDNASRRPGIDGSRIVLAGVSDGGSGALWVSAALRKTLAPKLRGVAIWSTDPDVMLAQNIQWNPASLKSLPVRWTAGGRDRLYPVQRIHAWWEACQSAGIRLEPHETDEADHDLQFHAADLALFPAWIRKTAR